MILKDRLHLYVQGNKDEFISQAEAEVSRLSNAGYYCYLNSMDINLVVVLTFLFIYLFISLMEAHLPFLSIFICIFFPAA